MYEDLIRDLRNEDAWKNCDFDFIHSWALQAADAIEVLSEKENTTPRWIPVTERLPEADGYDARGYAVPYLVMNGWMRVTARRTKDYWVLFGNSTVLEYVTHWMPLPEPPKEET